MSLNCPGTGYVEATTTSSLPTIQSNKTVTAWIYANSWSGTNGFLNVFLNSNAIQFGSRGGSFGMWEWGGGFLVSTANPPIDEWLFVAYTRNANSHTIWINESTTSSTSDGQSGQPTNIQIGGNQFSEPYDGQIEDMRIYNRLLSNNEITTIYNLSGRDCVCSGLVARWAFLDGSSGTNISSEPFEDISGNGHNQLFIASGTYTYGTLNRTSITSEPLKVV